MPDRTPIDRAVILAGGGGTRLWPWTGPSRPKPLLPLGGGGRSLLRATLERLDGLVGRGGVSIQAAPGLEGRLRAAEPGIAVDTEPSPRDTAPAVALAMRRVLERDPGAVVAIVPADQRIDDLDAYRRALVRAGDLARSGELVLLAVPPSSASTRFGYLECATAAGDLERLDVVRFVEKPDSERAAAFAYDGRHFWNAGLFVWRADRFDEELRRRAPRVADAVERTLAGETAAWEGAPRTSIDYALLEKTDRLAAVRLDAGWDDVGSWDAVARLPEVRDASGPVESLEPGGDAASGSIVLAVAGCRPPGRLVLLGDEPLLVVFGPEGVLVSPRGASDRVRRFAG